MMDTREAGNEMILKIAERDRYDMILYPLMIAVVILSYLSILSFYVLSLFSEYGGSVPTEHVFGTLALLLMGISIILAIFYLLMVRNTNHSERESSLRKSMISYVEANSLICGCDLSQHIMNLKKIDERYDNEEKMGDPKKRMFWIVLPAFLGFALMWFPSLRDNALLIIIISFIASLLLTAVVSPHLTSFASSHDKRTMEFTAAFCNACRLIDMKLVPVSRTVGYRSFNVFLILTIVTLGFFSIVWVYLVFNDMNKHFMEQWKFEDTLLRTVRSSETEYIKTKHKGVDYLLEDNWIK